MLGSRHFGDTNADRNIIAPKKQFVLLNDQNFNRAEPFIEDPGSSSFGELTFCDCRRVTNPVVSSTE